MNLFTPASPLWTGRALALLRIVAGFIFVTAGMMKLFGFPPPPAVMPPIPIVPPMWEIHLAGILEMVGGIAIIFGFLTRPIAFILSGEMAVAYWQLQAPISPWLTANGGAPTVIFCFVYFYLSFAGAGPWSIDSMIAQSRSRAAP